MPDETTETTTSTLPTAFQPIPLPTATTRTLPIPIPAALTEYLIPDLTNFVIGTYSTLNVQNLVVISNDFYKYQEKYIYKLKLYSQKFGSILNYLFVYLYNTISQY